jgi:hypothetical protein
LVCIVAVERDLLRVRSKTSKPDIDEKRKMMKM